MRHVPHRSRQDASSGSGPSGRQQVPRDPLPRHVARHRQDSARGGRPGAVFGIAKCDVYRIAPATLRQASYGTIKIGTYQSLKRLLAERPQDETLATNVLCGVLAGVVSSSIANPTDVLKIRMQAQGRVIRGSMMGNFISIYQQEGTRGLWKVQLRVRPGGGAGLQPGGRGPDADDESERSGFVPGNARLRAADVALGGSGGPLQGLLPQLAPPGPVEHHLLPHVRAAQEDQRLSERAEETKTASEATVSPVGGNPSLPWERGARVCVCVCVCARVCVGFLRPAAAKTAGDFCTYLNVIFELIQRLGFVAVRVRPGCFWHEALREASARRVTSSAFKLPDGECRTSRRAADNHRSRSVSRRE
ncbi:uncharacterized protein LOC133489243 isoform X2 [Phyllopteryx taeniolatus]|uniref:uncharacterized protein LOC133489243 isoform X2 n=1 Tax=Phyllopteryx taeniolatus TaxID=161469 RepID=UPI002AD2CB21|nr:uncharacterized protein LOC133489243 isoform X2 [Phyllopteryx taeniolatus]